MDRPGLSMAEELNRVGHAGLTYPPGERWAYSVAMDVFGAVMEVVEGRSLDSVVAEHVTAPLKLVATGFYLTVERRDMLVTPYADGVPAPVRIPDSGQRIRFPDSVPVYAGLAGVNLVPARLFDRASFHSGGSGMVGTADDMLALVEAIRGGGDPILARNTAASMMTVQTGDFPIPNRGPGWAFGFGGGVLTDPAAAQSPQSPGTLGWGGVWGNGWFVDPVRRLSVVWLTNTALEGMMGRFARDLRNAVYADLG